MASRQQLTVQELTERIVNDPAGLLLCTDFDGTLAPIVADPMAARPAPGAIEALEQLAAHIGAVAIVTGRDVRTVHQLAGLDRLGGLPNMVAIGQYGVERWDAAANNFDIPDQPETIKAAIAEIESLIDESGLHGVHVEDKKLAVGVHTRRCPDPAAALARLEPQLRNIASAHDLQAEPGKFVLELRAEKLTKGDAVRRLVDEFEPAELIFMGDDLGDLAAFDVVDDWRAGGKFGAKIAVASDEQPAVAERADLVFEDQAALVDWLTDLVDRLAAER